MEKKNILVTFLQAYLLCIGAMNRLIGIILDKDEGVMIINLLPVAGLTMLHFFMADKKNDLNLNKKALLFVYYITSIIVVSKYAVVPNNLPYREVLVYCFIPMYLSLYKVDVKKLLEFIMLFSVLVIPISEEFFVNIGLASYETIGMGTSYGVLPYVAAAIVHFRYYRKKTGVLCWVAYAANIYYLFKIITMGSRGPLVSLFVLFALLVLHDANKDGSIKKNTTKRTVMVVLITVGAILVVNNIEAILVYLQKLLSGFGVRISAIDKSVLQIRRGDLSNGRTRIYEYTIDCIKQNWILGHGVSSFMFKSSGLSPYPHNLFLQIWYDIGILISIPLMVILFKACKKTIFENLSLDYSVALMLLLSISVPKLLYSAEFWKDISFWLFLMYSISPNIYGEKTYKAELHNDNESVKE